MRAARRLVVALALAVLSSLACEEFLPVNPYDPRTPPSEQAPGAIQGILFLDDNQASVETITGELNALSVTLQSGDGEPLTTLRCGQDATTAGTMTCEPAARTASFQLRDLGAGDYRIAVDGLSPRYIPVAIAPIGLLPGELRDLGRLRYAVLPIDVPDPDWTGRVQVEATLGGGLGGPRRVTLYRQGSSGLDIQATATTDSAGLASFDQLPPGVYAVAAELQDFTPDYRAGFELRGADVVVEQNTQAFTGASALVLHPVSAVLVPQLQQTFGAYYTNGDAAPVQVLLFGGMNQMRLSTDPGFDDDSQGWVDHAATVDVALPDREGAIAIYAQFRNTSVAGFTFVSGVYQSAVIRDVSAPEVLDVQVRGRPAGDDGKIWLRQDSSLLSVDVDGQDAVSAVHSFVLHHDAAGSAGDPTVLSFTSTDSPGGLLRLDEEIGLTAGEGEKKIYVYLRDRAGNTSAEGEISVWVDSTPPTIDTILVDGGAAVTGARALILTLSASDLNRVVGMRTWEEGQPEPTSWTTFAAASTLQLQPLDYARTLRQINARVVDQAGNASTTGAVQIAFDDRGQVSGLLVVEDAADGSPGTVAGLAALVGGQSYPVHASAGSSPGDPWRFVISAIPAAANLALRLTKAGYADAAAGSLFTVEPGQDTELGLLTLHLARGSIEGWVQIEGSADHSNAIARVDSTGQFALTDSSGYFSIDQVPARSGYSVTLSYDSVHGSEVVTGVDVPAVGTVRISQPLLPIVLPLLAGSFSIVEGTYSDAPQVTLRLAYDGATEFRASTARGDLQNDLIGWSAFSNAVGSTTGYTFDLPPVDGLYTIHVQFRDPTPGTGFTSEIFSDAVTLDQTAPANVALLLNGGAAYTKTLAVTLTPSATDANPIVELQLSHRDTAEAGDLQEGDWEAARAWNGQPLGVVLPGNAAYRTARVWVRLVDAAGNVSAPALASVVVDPIPPTGGSIAIEGGDAVTRSFLVTLSLTAVDDTPVEMLIADDAVPATGTWRSFVGSTAWVLPPATQGSKTVCVAFRDAADNRSQDYCDSIDYDSLAPPVPAVSLPGGTYTQDPDLVLALSNITGVTTVEVAGNAAFAGASAYAAQSQVRYLLEDPDGAKVVFVRYLDAAGNASDPAVLTVVLDRLAPEASGFALVDGDFTSSLRPELRLSAIGASEMLLSASASCSGGSWIPYGAQGFVDLAPPDGVKDISVQFRDQALNLSGCLTRQITMDRLEPQLGSPALTLGGLDIVLNAAGTAVDATYARLDLSVSGATEMKISNLDGTPDATWQTFAPLIPEWRLLPGDGTRQVYVRFRDAARNTSAQVSASIAVDSTGDLTGVLALEGSVDYSDVVIALGGVAQTYSMATNRFTVANLLTKSYPSLTVRKPDYDTAVIPSGVYVPGGGTIDVGTLTVKRSRGDVVGYLQLSDRLSHENILVELLNTGYTATTNSTGFFSLPGVLAGSYTLVARRDGYSPLTYGPFVVQSQLTTRVPTSGSLLLSPQTGDFTINGQNGGYTSGRDVTLDLTYNQGVGFRASEDSTFAGGTQPYQTFAAALCTGSGGNFDCPFQLADADGLRTVHVQFEEAGGQFSDVFESSITLDRVPPAIGSVLIADGLTHVNDLSVQVSLTSSDSNGLVSMQLSTDGTTWRAPEPFQDPYTWTYADPTTGAPNPDDNLCLRARFFDPAGNPSSTTVAGAASDCIVLDRQAPQPGAPPVTLQNAQGTALNGGVTTTSNVFAVASATGAGQMMLSNRSNFNGASWQPYEAVPLSWILVAGDGARTVYVAYRDLAGNSVGTDGTLNAGLTVDTLAPPAPIFTIAQGTVTGSRSLTFTLSNPTAGETVLFESNRALGVVQTAAAQVGVSFDLPDVEGVHALTLRYRDPAGNSGPGSTASVELDRVAPVLAYFAVEGSGYTGAGIVNLLVDAVGASSMRFMNQGGAWSGWESYQQRRLAWPLDTSAQGNRTILVQLRDAALNPSTGSPSAVVYFDSALPTTATLAINGGATHTATRGVNLTLGATDAGSGIVEMRIAAGTSPGGTWEPYVGERLWTLVDGVDGNRDLTAEFRDRAGNPRSATASIALDRATPTLDSFTVTGDGGEPAGYSRDSSVTLAMQSSDADPTVQYCVSSSASFAGATCGTLSVGPPHTVAINAWALTPGPGVQTVQVKVWDRAGNTAYGSGSVTVDGSPPDLLSLSLQEDAQDLHPGNGYTRWTSTTLQIGALGALQRCVVGPYAGAPADCAPGSLGWEGYGASKAISLNTGDAVKDLDLYLRDAARNVAGPFRVSERLDTTAPSTCQVALTGTTYDVNDAPVDDTARTALSVVRLAITAVDAAPGSPLLDVQVSNDGTFGGAELRPFTTSPMDIDGWLLAGGAANDESRSVWIRCRDAADNVATSAPDSILYDNVPPSGGSLLIASGAQYTLTLANVGLTLSAAGASHARWGTGTPLTGTWQASWAGATATFVGSEGTKTAYAQFRDLAGNATAVASDTIEYDSGAPAAPTTLNVAGILSAGTYYVATTTPALSWVASSSTDVESYQVQIGATVYTTTAVSFVTPVLADSSYTWRVQAVDRAGRPSGWVSGPNFVVDTQPPPTPRFATVASPVRNLTTGATCATDDAVDLDLAVTSTAFDHYEISGGHTRAGDPTCAQLSDFVDATAYMIDVDTIRVHLRINAAATIRLRAVDAAGNRSDVDFVNLVEDSISPTDPVLAALPYPTFGGRSVLNASSITLNLATPSTDAYPGSYQLCSCDPTVSCASCDAAGGGWASSPSQDNFSFNLQSRQNATTRLCVRGCDQAANCSLADCEEVIEDSTPPTPPVLYPADATAIAERVNLSVITASSDAHLSGYEVRGGLGYPDFTLVTDPPPFSIDLARDAVNDVEVRAVDLAGNVSSVARSRITEQQTTVLDRVPREYFGQDTLRAGGGFALQGESKASQLCSATWQDIARVHLVSAAGTVIADGSKDCRNIPTSRHNQVLAVAMAPSLLAYFADDEENGVPGRLFLRQTGPDLTFDADDALDLGLWKNTKTSGFPYDNADYVAAVDDKVLWMDQLNNALTAVGTTTTTGAAVGPYTAGNLYRTPQSGAVYDYAQYLDFTGCSGNKTVTMGLYRGLRNLATGLWSYPFTEVHRTDVVVTGGPGVAGFVHGGNPTAGTSHSIVKDSGGQAAYHFIMATWTDPCIKPVYGGTFSRQRVPGLGALAARGFEAAYQAGVPSAATTFVTTLNPYAQRIYGMDDVHRENLRLYQSGGPGKSFVGDPVRPPNRLELVTAIDDTWVSAGGTAISAAPAGGYTVGAVFRMDSMETGRRAGLYLTAPASGMFPSATTSSVTLSIYESNTAAYGNGTVFTRKSYETLTMPGPGAGWFDFKPGSGLNLQKGRYYLVLATWPTTDTFTYYFGNSSTVVSKPWGTVVSGVAQAAYLGATPPATLTMGTSVSLSSNYMTARMAAGTTDVNIRDSYLSPRYLAYRTENALDPDVQAIRLVDLGADRLFTGEASVQVVATPTMPDLGRGEGFALSDSALMWLQVNGLDTEVRYRGFGADGVYGNGDDTQRILATVPGDVQPNLGLSNGYAAYDSANFMAPLVTLYDVATTGTREVALPSSATRWTLDGDDLWVAGTEGGVHNALYHKSLGERRWVIADPAYQAFSSRPYAALGLQGVVASSLDLAALMSGSAGDMPLYHFSAGTGPGGTDRVERLLPASGLWYAAVKLGRYFLSLYLPAGSATTEAGTYRLIDPTQPPGSQVIDPGLATGPSLQALFIEQVTAWGQRAVYAEPFPGVGIQTPAGSAFVDGDDFTVTDEQDVSATFEYDLGGGCAAGNVCVAITGADPATTVASKTRTAFDGAGLAFTTTLTGAWLQATPSPYTGGDGSISESVGTPLFLTGTDVARYHYLDLADDVFGNGNDVGDAHAAPQTVGFPMLSFDSRGFFLAGDVLAWFDYATSTLHAVYRIGGDPTTLVEHTYAPTGSVIGVVGDAVYYLKPSDYASIYWRSFTPGNTDPGESSVVLMSSLSSTMASQMALLGKVGSRIYFNVSTYGSGPEGILAVDLVGGAMRNAARRFEPIPATSIFSLGEFCQDAMYYPFDPFSTPDLFRVQLSNR